MHLSSWTRIVALAFATVVVCDAQAISCMVMGDTTARVQTPDGEKSPVFLSQACESLRLVSGKAMVSWIGRDGKPHLVPIGRNGAEGLPAAGAEERSANVVWAELTSKREAERPAFMRALEEERPARVYVPPEGLALTGKAGASFRLLAVDGEREDVVLEKKSGEASAVRLTRTEIKPGAVYILEWHQDGVVEKSRWRSLDAAETARIDEPYQQVQAEVTDEAQRRVLTAMLFEQLKLRVNMALALSFTP